MGVRNWHPASTPLSFYCVEAGRLKKNYVSGALCSQGLVCTSVFPMICMCERFGRWMWGRDCFSCCFYSCCWPTGLWGRSFSAAVFQGPVPVVWLLRGCSGDGVCLIVSLQQGWCVLEVSGSIGKLLLRTLFLPVRGAGQRGPLWAGPVSNLFWMSSCMFPMIEPWPLF